MAAAIPKIYLIQSGEVTGPYTWQEVEHLTETGAVSGFTECCEEGSNSWLPLRHFADSWQAGLAEPVELTVVSEPLALMTDKPKANRWFVVMQGGTVGPYGMADLRSLVKQKLITAETMVCLEGDSQWHPLGLALPKLKARRAVNRTVLHHTGIPKPSTKPRSGCLHLVGFLIFLAGAIGCFTIVALPLGVMMMLAGGVLMIAAR